MPPAAPGRLVLDAITIKNYRVLKSVTLDRLTPITVLIGPNGGGKSTLLDALSFLADCFEDGLKKAVSKRGRFRDLVSRGSEGPIEFELTLRDPQRSDADNKIIYRLAITQQQNETCVFNEELLIGDNTESYLPGLTMAGWEGNMEVVYGQDLKIEFFYKIYKNGLSALTIDNLRFWVVTSVFDFIIQWRLYDFDPAQAALSPNDEPTALLEQTGKNLSNVLMHLQQHHPDVLEEIFTELRRRIPRLERAYAQDLSDGRLRVMLKDVDFDQPIPGHLASDGTMEMLAYLTLLKNPTTPSLIGLEEPERHLHPRLLPSFAEDCLVASDLAQLFITTHSPALLNRFEQEDIRVLHRGEDGLTQVTHANDIPGLKELNKYGGALGDLWLEGHFHVGDPLYPT